MHYEILVQSDFTMLRNTQTKHVQGDFIKCYEILTSGVNSFLKLGGQVLSNAARYRRCINKLSKTGWAIAHSAHPPVTPLVAM